MRITRISAGRAACRNAGPALPVLFAPEQSIFTGAPLLVSLAVIGYTEIRHTKAKNILIN